MGVNHVSEWMTTVQRRIHVEEEPHWCLPVSAICAIDCPSEDVDKERRTVALHGRKLRICIKNQCLSVETRVSKEAAGI
jgi:hypothetical protein